MMKLPFFSVGTGAISQSLKSMAGLVLASVLPFAGALVADVFIRGLSPTGLLELLSQPIASTSGTMADGGVNANVSIGNVNIQSVEDALSALAWLVATSIAGLGILVARAGDEALSIVTPVKAIAKAPLFTAAVVVVYLVLSVASIAGFGPMLLGSALPETIPGAVRMLLSLSGAVLGIIVFLYALRLSLLPASVAIGDGFHIGALQDRTRGNSLRLFTNYFLWALMLVVIMVVASLLVSLPLNFIQSLLAGEGGASVVAAVPGVIWHGIRLSMLMVANGSLAIFAALAYTGLLEREADGVT